MTWVLIRAAGAGLVMAGCILAGFSLERRMRVRWMILQEMQETFVFLEKEMIYHRSPVQEAFKSASEKCVTELAGVLLYAADRIEKRNGQSFLEIWKEALKCCIPAGLFREEEFRVLCGAARALSGADTVVQRTLLEKYADCFRRMSREEAEACREKGSLYRKLAAAAGIFLILILL